MPSKTQLDKLSSVYTSMKAWLAETAADVPTAWRDSESPAVLPSQMKDNSESLPCNASAKSWSVSDLSQEAQNMSQIDKGPDMPLTDDGSGQYSKPYIRDELKLPARGQLAPDGKIGRWLENISPPPTIILDVRGFSDMSLHDQELDVCTGEFLPPIEQPEVTYLPLGGPCVGPRDMAWRRINMTSELFVARAITIHQKLDKTRKEAMNEEATKSPPKVNEWLGLHKCIVRPVLPEDYEHIANIMNLEMKMEDSPQIFEDTDFTADDVAAMAERCRLNRRPFIVALLPDPLMDESKWPQDSSNAYQAYVRYKQTQKVGSLLVVGFAVVLEARFGLKETVDAGSRFCGQVRIIVHPDWRQKRIGSALMDKILCTEKYEWSCTGNLEAFDASCIKHRYVKLYVELFCEGGRDETLVWRESLLFRLGFSPVGYLPSAVKTATGGVNRWLDLGIWEYAIEQP
ncbi:hypothetical protein CDD81_5704 [Ophiocordyceps australis]|uniref:N-acetyltransferase domain-containing protein n=1 Tax=Ophiocordyceps australis TaxID=1399860 RepID=A0A2C5Y8N6_9HYPO|nr:hypothetical protein CDD81_5704 [Ophiocordyceps australis]